MSSIDSEYSILNYLIFQVKPKLSFNFVRTSQYLAYFPFLLFLQPFTKSREQQQILQQFYQTQVQITLYLKTDKDSQLNLLLYFLHFRSTRYLLIQINQYNLPVSYLYLQTRFTSMATELLPMTEEHTQEVADLLTRNFLSNNPIWKSFNLDNHQVFKFFINEIRLHLDSEAIIKQTINPNVAFNMVYFHEGKIIAAGFNFELHEYLKVSSLPGQSETLQHFQILQNHGKKLFDSLKVQEHEKGKHIYGSFIVIDQNVDKEVKKAFRNKAIMSTYKKFIHQGFKSLILRTSHIGSQKIYLSLGAKILSEVEFELKGQKFQLKLLKLEFDNPIFSKMMGL